MEFVPTEPGMPDSVDPFADPLFDMGFPNFPVVKISNIPYSATKQEVAHFLGRDSQVDMIDEFTSGTPIHIIMERSTSKTMDCYIEMKSYRAVVEQFKRHWESVTGASNRPPRIGLRLVTVEVATQDELMKDIFPRAKCVHWENGKPLIMENEDPYSTGFTGYFTNEELVGLVRHAEHPTRSPFSMKCLQRTYECMIDTVCKFPWAACNTYTIGDRNNLFVTYMKLLDVLVYKVDEMEVVALSQQLLLSYLFAGLNCRGFGERQRGLIHARGGRHAAPIQVLQIHSYWPFDVIGKKRDMKDEEYCKGHLNLIEKGVQALSAAELMPAYFIHAEGRLPGGLPPPIRITHFEFKAECQGLTFEAATEVEMQLVARLLSAGRQKMNWASPGTHGGPNLQSVSTEELERNAGHNVAERFVRGSLERLRLQTEVLKKGKDEEQEWYKDNNTPTQKSKVELTPRSVDFTSADHSPIDPGPSSRVEIRRRLSEPQLYTGSLGAGLDISPLRNMNGSRAIPIKDPKTKMHSTPTKGAKRAIFAVGDTIHEESETEGS